MISISEQAARQRLESMRTELVGRLGHLAGSNSRVHRPAVLLTRLTAGTSGLMPHTLGILKQVEEALRRLDRGQYGVCQTCGGDIRLDRLEALPYATVCIECSLKQADA